ncbi:restriction endonuclease subunit S [Vibrio vulnificus]|nr:restriction endonuclease subunit S [Vibrio vulnificus]ELP6768690.1 restriction endonuclease subunit S [Vibrio vulnificus]
MAGRYKAYPEYRESGVKWLEEVPVDWKVSRLKFISSIFGRIGFRGYTTADIVDEGEGALVLSPSNVSDGKLDLNSKTFLSWHKYYESPEIIVEPNDILLVKTGSTFGKSAIVDYSSEPMTINPQMALLKRSKIPPKYLAYVMSSKLIKSLIDVSNTGSGMPTMTQENINSFPIPLPPSDWAECIANFLDHETAKIDTLITNQEKLIELLKEKRQAVISHAVTKGLNPNAPMKDSGVEWVGEVPKHWVICAIKRQLKSLDYRRIPLSADERGKRSGEFRYYGASGVIDYIDDYIFDEPTVLVGEDGANLVNRSTPLAFSAFGQYWVNNHAHILSPKDGLADYWSEVIEIIDVTPLVSGSAQPKLTAEALGNLKIAFPPLLEEREAINDFVRNQKIKYDSLTCKAQQQVKLLKERKTALISAAVTGKIDVRDWESK